ncbi:MAG: hypothetical protein JXR96_05250 [Deltaproteobacteria bacterium]|nr:hypothetical protein [Deltaproteobacteria bacterium]
MKKFQYLAEKTRRLAPFLRPLLAEMSVCGPLSICLCSGLLAASCVLGPIEPPEEPPLYSPQILLESLQPPLSGLTTIETECPKCTFEAKVRDLNIDDLLFIWWFLDWDGADYSSNVKDDTIGKMGTIDRYGDQLKYTVNLSEKTPAFKETRHVVTLVVADRWLGDEEWHSDSHSWTFELVNGGVYCDPED